MSRLTKLVPIFESFNSKVPELIKDGDLVLSGIVGNIKYVTPGISNPKKSDVLYQVFSNLSTTDEEDELGIEEIHINVTTAVEANVINDLENMGSLKLYDLSGNERKEATQRAVEMGLANLDMTYGEQEKFFKTGSANFDFYSDIEDNDEIFFVSDEDDEDEDDED